MADTALMQENMRLKALLAGPTKGRSIAARLEALIAYYVTDVGPDYSEIPVVREQINMIRDELNKEGE